jgi:hypothetical protein
MGSGPYSSCLGFYFYDPRKPRRQAITAIGAFQIALSPDPTKMPGKHGRATEHIARMIASLRETKGTYE